MEKTELHQGDVLQLKPDYPEFGGMLIVVTEPKTWGCQGYLLASRIFHACRFNGRAYLRPNFEDMEFVGKLTWIEEDELDED